jgi:glycosyltransferase involved in cell wall biosynthesis
MNPLTILRAVVDHDVVFGWFASWHTLFPAVAARMLGKPAVLVVGGYDLANMPGIDYGHQRGGIKKYVSICAMRAARSLVTNSYFSRRELAENAGIDEDRVSVLHHGLPDEIGALPERGRLRLALTVGNLDRVNLKRKGLEAFVRAAAYLPEVQFVLVGKWKDDAIERLKQLASPNVSFSGRISHQALKDLYLSASVYVQASAHEGFGLSVAEAMLAGCIPVVVKAGALPEVVADCGVYASSQDAESVAKAVAEAMTFPEAARAKARERILNGFPFHRRREGLYALVDRLTENH